MLKFWIGGAVVATAVSAATFAGWSYASHQAMAAIDARFAVLRANGIDAGHGPIVIDLWKRSARIDDIHFSANGIETELKSLALTGVDPWTSDLVADQADFTALHVTASVSGPTSTPVRLVIDEPTATATRLHVRATPLDLAEAKGSAQQFAALFAAVDAATTSIPSLKARLEFQEPAGATRFDATYADVRLDGIHDGRIATFSNSKATFDSTSGTRTVGHGSIEEFRVTSIDALPYFEIGLSRRIATDGYYPVQGDATAGAGSFEATGAAKTDFAATHSGAVSIDPSKVSVLKIENLISDIGSISPASAPDAAAKMLDRISQIYEGIQIASVEIDGMHSTSRESAVDSEVKCERIALSEWSRGRSRIDALRSVRQLQEPVDIACCNSVEARVHSLLWPRPAEDTENRGDDCARPPSRTGPGHSIPAHSLWFRDRRRGDTDAADWPAFRDRHVFDPLGQFRRRYSDRR